jgi:hypothetical protein
MHQQPALCHPSATPTLPCLSSDRTPTRVACPSAPLSGWCRPPTARRSSWGPSPPCAIAWHPSTPATLLPPPRGRAHADPPPLSSSPPRATEPPFKSVGRRSTPVHPVLLSSATRAELRLPELTFMHLSQAPGPHRPSGFGQRCRSPPFPRCAALRASPLPIHGPHSPLSPLSTCRVHRQSSGTTGGHRCRRSTAEPKLFLHLDVTSPVR